MLEELAAKVEAGEPLSGGDIEALDGTRDIIALGMLATTVRRKLHGTAVTFVRVADARLDAMAAPDAEAGEYRLFRTPATLDETVAVTEQGRALAGQVPFSAFCLYELTRLPEGLAVVLPALKRAGLESVAQAPIDRLEHPERDLEALTDAGLRVSRLTVNESPEGSWTAVCRRVSDLQTRLQSIRVFAPLPRTIDRSRPTTGYDDVRRVALARVLVENVDTIQVDWALYGPKLAQVALTFGADDIDSVSLDADEARGRRRAPLEEIRRSIRAAGFEPLERNARFERRG